MNDRDKQNLEFLMSITPETLRDWFNTVSQDDIDYAKELLDRADLVAAAQECIDAQNIDCTIAKQILSQFTMKGSK